MTPDKAECPWCDYKLSATDEIEGYCPRCENALVDDDPWRDEWEEEALGAGDIDTGWPGDAAVIWDLEDAYDEDNPGDFDW